MAALETLFNGLDYGIWLVELGIELIDWGTVHRGCLMAACRTLLLVIMVMRLYRIAGRIVVIMAEPHLEMLVMVECRKYVEVAERLYC